MTEHQPTSEKAVSTSPMEVFCSYSHQDEDLRNKLEKHLTTLRQEGYITIWHDGRISAGQEWAGEIDRHLNTAQIILLLVSADFLASQYCNSVELKQAIKRHEQGEARVIPIILRPVDWEGTPLGKLQALPEHAKPVTTWYNEDGAFKNVAEGIRKAVKELIANRPASKQSQDTLPEQARPKGQIQVCFVSSEYPPYILGGLGVHVEELTKALRGQVSVDVVLPATPPRSNEKYREVPGVHLRETSTYASYSNVASWINFSKTAAETIMKIKPRVIHCHDWVTVLAGVYCRRKLDDIRLLLHLHLPNRSPLCASVENLGLVYADLVTVNSEDAKKEIGRRGLGDIKIEIINNGVNINRFKPYKDWPDDEGYILFVGRLTEQKGVAYLLRAFSYVIEKYPDMKLKIVGDGPDRSWLETLAKNLLIPDNRVEFLGEKISSDLEELYQKAQIIVIPSIYEPFGMVALEAMACKRPVIASNVGGLPGIIKQDKISGYLVESRDVLGLSQYMMALIHDAELRKKMGEEGYKVAMSEEYQWSCIAEKLVGFYQELSQPRRHTRKPARADEFCKEIRNASARLPWTKNCRDALNFLLG